MKRAHRRLLGVLAFAAVNIGGLATASPASAAVTSHTFEVTNVVFELGGIQENVNISPEDCFIDVEVDDAPNPNVVTITDIQCGPIDGTVTFNMTGTGNGPGTDDGTTVSLPFQGSATLEGSACIIGPMVSPPNLTGPHNGTSLSASELDVPAIQSGGGCSAFEAAALNALIGLPGEAALTFNGSWSPALP